MNVISIKSTTTKTYTVRIEDGEVRDQPYSRIGGQYRVRRVEVIKRDGNISKVELVGVVVKKNGHDGVQPAREHLWNPAEWPQWLTSVIGGLA